MDHWQDITAVCLVAAAGLYLARVLRRRLARGTPGCGNRCAGCGGENREDSAAPQVVRILRDSQPPSP